MGEGGVWGSVEDYGAEGAGVVGSGPGLEGIGEGGFFEEFDVVCD